MRSRRASSPPRGSTRVALIIASKAERPAGDVPAFPAFNAPGRRSFIDGPYDFAACAPLNPDEQKRLTSIMNSVDVPAHQPIFDEADTAEHVYNVTGGAVKIYKLLPDGRRQITGFLLPGDFLGLTHKEAYAYSAEALVPTTLCRFPRRKLEGLLDEMPKLEQRLLGIHDVAQRDVGEVRPVGLAGAGRGTRELHGQPRLEHHPQVQSAGWLPAGVADDPDRWHHDLR